MSPILLYLSLASLALASYNEQAIFLPDGDKDINEAKLEIIDKTSNINVMENGWQLSANNQTGWLLGLTMYHSTWGFKDEQSTNTISIEGSSSDKQDIIISFSIYPDDNNLQPEEYRFFSIVFNISNSNSCLNNHCDQILVYPPCGSEMKTGNIKARMRDRLHASNSWDRYDVAADHHKTNFNHMDSSFNNAWNLSMALTWDPYDDTNRQNGNGNIILAISNSQTLDSTNTFSCRYINVGEDQQVGMYLTKGYNYNPTIINRFTIQSTSESSTGSPTPSPTSQPTTSSSSPRPTKIPSSNTLSLQPTKTKSKIFNRTAISSTPNPTNTHDSGTRIPSPAPTELPIIGTTILDDVSTIMPSPLPTELPVMETTIDILTTALKTTFDTESTTTINPTSVESSEITSSIDISTTSMDTTFTTENEIGQSTSIQTTTTEYNYESTTILSIFSTATTDSTQPNATNLDIDDSISAATTNEPKHAMEMIIGIVVVGVCILLTIVCCAIKASKSKVKEKDHPSRFEFENQRNNNHNHIHHKANLNNGNHNPDRLKHVPLRNIAVGLELINSHSKIEPGSPAANSPISPESHQDHEAKEALMNTPTESFEGSRRGTVNMDAFNTPGNLVDNNKKDLDVDNLEENDFGDVIIVKKRNRDTLGGPDDVKDNGNPIVIKQRHRETWEGPASDDHDEDHEEDINVIQNDEEYKTPRPPPRRIHKIEEHKVEVDMDEIDELLEVSQTIEDESEDSEYDEEDQGKPRPRDVSIPFGKVKTNQQAEGKY